MKDENRAVESADVNLVASTSSPASRVGLGKHPPLFLLKFSSFWDARGQSV